MFGETLESLLMFKNKQKDQPKLFINSMNDATISINFFFQSKTLSSKLATC